MVMVANAKSALSSRGRINLVVIIASSCRCVMSLISKAPEYPPCREDDAHQICGGASVLLLAWYGILESWRQLRFVHSTVTNRPRESSRMSTTPLDLETPSPNFHITPLGGRLRLDRLNVHQRETRSHDAPATSLGT
ncbi:hypothetical protein TNCV_509801 [Trichonephila clavipes]|nr:hypothetical protein TNCV_509801 [Trichonephila clavipes]